MREIKFRAWYEELKVMDYGNGELGGYQEFNCSALKAVNDIINQNYPELVWMQYTGIKDVNGKDIYEGDILESGYFHPLFREFISEKYTVAYDRESFVGKLIGYTPFGDKCLHFIKGEVIGNIYENPELLEGKQNE